MKSRIVILLMAMVTAFGAFSQQQYVTSFTITDLNNQSLANKVQATLTSLVTEINKAHGTKRTPSLANLNIDESTKESIMMLWENSPFRCLEPEIVEAAMKTYNSNEYEIRNIPFSFTDFDEDDQYHEAAITFNSNGVLTSFHMVISQNLYTQVMRSNNTVTDLRRRQMILDYVEQFRTAYNTKDIAFLEQVFSEDALIITGRVVTPRKTNSKEFGLFVPTPRIEYTKHSKQEYISKMRKIFRSNKRIRVTFDEIEVVMHPTNPDFYGVTLKQGYTSDRYHDDGYLFLLWDFTNESSPQIHVRTWQPDKIGGKTLPRDEVFNLNDFDIE